MESLVQAAHRVTPTRFSLAINLDSLAQLKAETGTQILFILREAISNISKHAHATTGVIRLGMSDGRVRFDIEDNGVWFDLESRQNAEHGLNNIRVRAQKLGAALDILSAPGRGASLSIANRRDPKFGTRSSRFSEFRTSGRAFLASPARRAPPS